MSQRALSFGSVAAAYERYRPGYPDELVTSVLSHAGRPVTTAFEIGAGTGKATRAFAARGVAVTASEPDPAMLDELRRHVPATVTPLLASFEDVRPGKTFDLVFAAASLHWTDPAGRWQKVARLLAPGGVFASFGGPFEVADPAVAQAVRDARAPFLDDDGVPSPDGTPDDTPDDSALQWPGTELIRSDLFDDVRQLVIERRVRLPADDYVGHLSTISAYLELAEPDRAEALRRIGAVLPEQVDLVADLTLHLARRVG